MKQLLRVIDANFNRFKEGLRVVEDLERFVLKNNNLRKRARNLRHSLDFLLKDNIIKEAIKYRDSEKDLGKDLDKLESFRKDYFDILYTNLQRSKEALRVLEELLKILKPKLVCKIKNIRYNVYLLERDIYTKQGFKNVNKDSN